MTHQPPAPHPVRDRLIPDLDRLAAAIEQQPTDEQGPLVVLVQQMLHQITAQITAGRVARQPAGRHAAPTTPARWHQRRAIRVVLAAAALAIALAVVGVLLGTT